MERDGIEAKIVNGSNTNNVSWRVRLLHWEGGHIVHTEYVAGSGNRAWARQVAKNWNEVQ